MASNRPQQFSGSSVDPAIIAARFSGRANSTLRKRAIGIPAPATPGLGDRRHNRVFPEATGGLTESAWTTLLDRIQDRMCTVFVGAGANDGILPVGDQIADIWAKTYKFPLATRELPRVAQFVAIEAKERHRPHDLIIKRFRNQLIGVDLDTKIKDSPLALLAQLPVTCYLTTNYDDFMYRALELVGKQPTRHICKWYKDENDPSKESRIQRNIPKDITASIDRPIVFHLHGHQSNPKSMVLTEDDYYDFLISWVRDQYMIPPFLQKALARTSLLFVGYRLADMSFRVLFRSVFRAMEVHDRYSNVAVQLPPEDAQEAAARRYLSEYFDKDNIHVFWGDATKFVKEFRPRLRELGIVK